MAIARGMWQKLTPVWDKLRADATVDPSKGLYASRVGEASADVNRTFGRARESEMRNLASSGIRPGSGRYQSSMRQLGLAQAAQGAGAMTMARRGVDREMEARRANYMAMSQPLIETRGRQINAERDRNLRGELGRGELDLNRDRLSAETGWRTDHNQLQRELGLLDAETRVKVAEMTGRAQEKSSKWGGLGSLFGTVGGVLAGKWLGGLF